MRCHRRGPCRDIRKVLNKGLHLGLPMLRVFLFVRAALVEEAASRVAVEMRACVPNGAEDKGVREQEFVEQGAHDFFFFFLFSPSSTASS